MQEPTFETAVREHIKFYTAPPWIIKWRGVQLKLSSGRSNWDAEYKAKAGLMAHIKKTGIWTDIVMAATGKSSNDAYWKNAANLKVVKDYVDSLIKDGDLQFINTNENSTLQEGWLRRPHR